MLGNGMVVARRPRLRGLNYMGDAALYDPTGTVWTQRPAVPPDMELLSQDQIASIAFTSKEQAVAFYKFLIASVAVRTKTAFMADLWAKIKATPSILIAVTMTQKGKDFVNALQAAEAFFLAYTQANTLQNIQLVRNQMEVNVLPKQFGIQVKGRLPLYSTGSAVLSYSDVTTEALNLGETLNFGDFYETSISEDLATLKKTADDLNVPGAKLGEPVTIAFLVVLFVGIILSTAVVGGTIYAIIRAVKDPPEMPTLPAGVDPRQWAEIMRLMSSGDTLKWVVAGGVVVLGGLALFHYWA